MEIAINNNIFQKAQSVAQDRGQNLTAVIENFLTHFIGKDVADDDTTRVPDVVLSLLGSVEPTGHDDINERTAYYQYLEEKYQ